MQARGRYISGPSLGVVCVGLWIDSAPNEPP